jgi:hypothetical protein
MAKRYILRPENISYGQKIYLIAGKYILWRGTLLLGDYERPPILHNNDTAYSIFNYSLRGTRATCPDVYQTFPKVYWNCYLPTAIY